MATFTNQATLSYNGISTNSNIVTGEIVDVLSVTKQSVGSVYRNGDTVTYIVNLVNTGTAAFTNLTLSDNLGAYVFGEITRSPLTYVEGSLKYYMNGTLQTAPTATAGTSLSISGISVPANGNATIIYQAKVNEFAPLETASEIINTVTVTGNGLTAPLTASETIKAANEPQLTITKFLSPQTVNENGQLTYTFIIQNTGNAAITAEDGAIVSDTFDPILNPIAVTFNSETLAAPANYAYNTETGVFATVPGQITVPAATYTRNETTGEFTITPGVSTLTITGTV